MMVTSVGSRVRATSIGFAVALAALGFLATTFVAGGRAEALMVLRLDDGTEQLTIADGGAGDLCPNAGCIVALADFASFDIVVSTGLVQGTLTIADMDLSSVVGCTSPFSVCSSGSGGSLTISLTNTDFVGPAGNVLVALGIGGSTTGGVEYEAFFDQSNTPFGTTTLLGALGPFGNGPFPVAFSGGATTSVVASTPFSLTQVVEVSHRAGASQITSFDAFVRVVPEPAALVLLGSALVAAGVIARFRSRPGRA